MEVSRRVCCHCIEGMHGSFKCWGNRLIGGSLNMSRHVGMAVYLLEHCFLDDLVTREGLIFENARGRSWSHNGKINGEGLKAGISLKTHIKMAI